MTYTGYTENGAFVLDDPVSLENGLKVSIVVLENKNSDNPLMPLRGSEYCFKEPFEPVDTDWESDQCS